MFDKETACITTCMEQNNADLYDSLCLVNHVTAIFGLFNCYAACVIYTNY